MPRFSDTDDSERVYRDGDGIDVSSIHAAVDEARKLAFDLFYEAPVVGRTIIAYVVRDEGESVVTVSC